MILRARFPKQVTQGFFFMARACVVSESSKDLQHMREFFTRVLVEVGISLGFFFAVHARIFPQCTQEFSH